MQEKKIKVLLCSPNNSAAGGISKWTAHVLTYYDNIKNDVNISLDHYYVSGRAIYQGTPLLLRVLYGFKSYIPLIFNFSNKIKYNHYDVTHLATSASISLLKDIIMLKLAKKYNVRTIIHFRFGRIPDLYNVRKWEQKWLHKVILLADKAVVIDKYSYDTLVKEGYKNIELLPNPLTPKISEIIENNKNIIREDLKIIFAGHVVETKGIFELIEACKEIENIKLKMIGYVPSEQVREKLIQKAGKNSKKWLEIAGEQNFETTIKEMLSAGVFVLPTYTEGFPNVILESMACACPIVASAVGAIPEMLDIENGENYGICVKPRNVIQLRESIQRMLNDRIFAINCGLNAQKRVNELYAMPKVWDRMVNIWESTLK